ncbi:MAG: hypothetical protein GKR89_21825 [Candidatus Latescibacteria bacterium]|nr:hypothetical protein [Candidatus Latescibacterota bacterium]
MRFLAPLCIALAIALPLQAQLALKGSFFINNQKDLDTLAQAGGESFRITGSLWIKGTILENLQGLEGLKRVGWGLYIQENRALKNLQGLENLSKIGGQLHVEENPALRDLTGLEQVQRVGGDLTLQANARLEQVDALARLAHIEGRLSLSNNTRLFHIDGLAALEVITGNLTIGGWSGGNPSLLRLDGLKGLKQVGERVYITNNLALTDSAAQVLVDHLQKREYAGMLVVRDNAAPVEATEP